MVALRAPRGGRVSRAGRSLLSPAEHLTAPLLCLAARNDDSTCLHLGPPPPLSVSLRALGVTVARHLQGRPLHAHRGRAAGRRRHVQAPSSPNAAPAVSRVSWARAHMPIRAPLRERPMSPRRRRACGPAGRSEPEVDGGRSCQAPRLALPPFHPCLARTAPRPARAGPDCSRLSTPACRRTARSLGSLLRQRLPACVPGCTERPRGPIGPAGESPPLMSDP